MKKYVLKATALAIGALVGGSAVADTNLDTGTVTGGTYAKELNYNSISPSTGTAITATPTVTSKLGFGVSAGQNRYIRVNLVGAKFHGGLTAADLVNTSRAFNNTVLAAGGQAGDSYAIFQVTADTTNGNQASDVVTFKPLLGYDVTSGNANVQVQFRLFETATAAVANTDSTWLYAASGDLLQFATGLQFSVTGALNSTADVAQSFTKFKTVAGSGKISDTLAKLGQVTSSAVTGVLNATGAQVTYAQLVGAGTTTPTGTKVVLKGDFSAAATNGVFLATDAACSTLVSNVAAAAAPTATGADIVTGANPLTGAYVCYATTGTTPIVASSYTAAVAYANATNSTTTNPSAQNLGSIDRDGTELLAPFATINSDYTARVFLTSSHTAPAKVTVKAWFADGSSCAAQALPDLKPGTQQEYLIKDICPTITGTAGSNTTRLSLRFTIAAPKNTVVGSYNQYNNRIDGAAAGAYGSKTTDMNGYVLVAPAAN
ncbi:hypothetical protein [Roseateles sp.]|uniref:hypothetical protein n=1 Tax=Roseateles sp. TaxID=1971397 RepID=UPI003BA985C4